MTKWMMTRWLHRLRKPLPEQVAAAVGKPRRDVCVINISSLLAQKGVAGTSVYAATKAGLLAFSRAVAVEAGEVAEKRKLDLGEHFRINSILPGYVHTPMVESLSEEARKSIRSKIPLGRFGTPDEIADAAVFLVANQYAHNCVVNLDGGLSAT